MNCGGDLQVRIAAGALACAGGVLALTVSPWFGLLPAFVGAGLVYAGITDRCGMAMVLAKLPYNRAASDRVGTCAAPIFPDASFATVFSNGVLEHVDQLEKGLREIGRVLKPGGRLIMTVPTMRDELELGGAALLRTLGQTSLATRYADAFNRFYHHVNVHEPDEWERLLSVAGLRLTHQRRYAARRGSTSSAATPTSRPCSGSSTTPRTPRGGRTRH